MAASVVGGIPFQDSRPIRSNPSRVKVSASGSKKRRASLSIISCDKSDKALDTCNSGCKLDGIASPLHESEPSKTNSSIDQIISDCPPLQPNVGETMLTILDSALSRAGHAPTQVSIRNKSLFGFDDAKIDTLRRIILKALRHNPEDFGLRMDSDGWVDSGHLPRPRVGPR